MKLPLILSKNKGRYILVGYIIFSFLYCVAAEINWFPINKMHLTFIDKIIPFMPNSIWVYDSQLPFLFLGLWFCQATLERTITYYAMLLATLISSSCFILIPTVFPHQILDVNGLTGLLWQALYMTDTPRNCFPSLHVALAILSAYALMMKNRYWRSLALAWATLICISTLTTKQHYLVDILAGMLVALVSWFIVKYALIAEYTDEKIN